jgi:hypothetical protein
MTALTVFEAAAGSQYFRRVEEQVPVAALVHSVSPL